MFIRMMLVCIVPFLSIFMSVNSRAATTATMNFSMNVVRPTCTVTSPASVEGEIDIGSYVDKNYTIGINCAAPAQTSLFVGAARGEINPSITHQMFLYNDADGQIARNVWVSFKKPSGYWVKFNEEDTYFKGTDNRQFDVTFRLQSASDAVSGNYSGSIRFDLIYV